MLFVVQGETSEASMLFKRTQEMLEDSLGRDHPNVAVVLSNHGAMLETQVGAVITSQKISCGAHWILKYNRARSSICYGAACLPG